MEKDRSLAHFIKYNNTVPIVLGILFFSTSATFAAVPAVRDSVYKADTETRSIDTTYLVSVDLNRYPFGMKITGITEDGEDYYLAYDFYTVGVVDGVWQDVTKQAILKVSKALLGSGDLRTYAESELAQVRSQEISRLNETQKLEKSLGSSQKVVATVYSGLVGDFVKPTEEIIPPYESKIASTDPLHIENPQPLLTWDANAVIPGDENTATSSQTQTTVPEEHLPIPDLCPGIEGIQVTNEACMATTTSSESQSESTTTPTPEEESPTPEPEPTPESTTTETPPVP